MLDKIDQLTAAMASGSEAAVEEFHRRYFNWLYAQAGRASGRDEAFCLDVVQEAMLKIIRTVKKVDRESAFRAWMRLVIQSTALDLLRQDTRRKNRELIAVASKYETADSAVETDAEDERINQINWLKNEIGRLDPKLVQMIEMRFNKQWTLARIGQWFGLSAGTIDGRLRRAITSLRAKAIEENHDR